MPTWNEIADAAVFWLLMRIHQPDLVTCVTLVVLVTVVVLLVWACADKAPTITSPPRRSPAIATPIHCLVIFIGLILVWIFPIVGSLRQGRWPQAQITARPGRGARPNGKRKMLEPTTGFEPVTYGLRNRCSTS